MVFVVISIQHAYMLDGSCEGHLSSHILINYLAITVVNAYTVQC